MKEFIGKKCFIVVLMGYKVLFYNSERVLSVSDSHITFKDKFDIIYCFKIKDIIQIHSENQGGESFVTK